MYIHTDAGAERIENLLSDSRITDYHFSYRIHVGKNSILAVVFYVKELEQMCLIRSTIFDF